MHSLGQPAPDSSRPEDDSPPPEPWHSPWSPEDELPASLPGPGSLYDTSLVWQINASFASQRRRQMNFLLVLSLAVFSFTVVAWVYVRDQALPWDTDLQSAPAIASNVVPQAPARLRLALDAARPSDAADLALRSPWQWDTPALARLVAANAPAFDNIKDLLGEDDWQPRHPAWKALDLGSHERWQTLGMAKEAAVAYYSRRGQDESAMQAGMELAAMAKRLQSIDAWPSYYNRGVEWHERACKAIAGLLRQTSLDARSLVVMQAEFERHSPSEAMLKERLTGFYEFERRLIVGPRRDDPWDQPAASLTADHTNRLFFKPNQTLSLFASSMRELKDHVSKAPSTTSGQLTRRIGPPGRPAGFPGGPNRSGLRYANDRIWRYAGLIEHFGLQRARHALVLTLFGVRRFTIDHGAPPHRLDELVPDYFTTLPADPYTGEPLRYDPARGLLYSVGMNFKSTGGHANDEPLSDNNEPTVMIR